MSTKYKFALLAFVLGAPVQAQQRDSVQALRLDPLVVSAERVRGPLNRSAAAVSLIGALELSQRPIRTLSEALQQTPGLAFLDFDGNGENPQVTTRGFYGGGEAEYMLMLLDGQPINAFETGRINWELIPVSAIESIEVVRGPASAAWGDAAVGGVIQINTRRNTTGWRGSFSGGEHGVLRAAASGNGMLGQRSAALFGNYSASNGYRAHAQRSDGSLHASLQLAGTAEKGISLSTFHDWRDFEEPGPLTNTELEASRTQSSPFYRFDQSDERLHRFAVDAHTPAGASGRLRGSLVTEYRNSDRIRTLRLAPEFADTKERVLSTTRVAASSAFETALAGGQFMLGVDASFARLDSEYFDYLQGIESDYQGGNPSRGDSNGKADGSRLSGAYFARYERELLPGVVASVATRLDGLRDSFTTDAETDDQTSTHHRFSNRAGLNARYASSERHEGHVYATIGQTFKAATPDQLYDRRMIPVPFEPFQITTSNADLKPQHGRNLEIGIYHAAVLSPDAVSLQLSASAYQMDLKDEIDFDVATFSYKNIGRSRHRGLELGLNLQLPASLGIFSNYTLQAPTAEDEGENQGNYLKAIPRHFLTAGISAGTSSGLFGSLSLTSARKMFLDDGNTTTLPDWTRFDARAGYTWRGVQVFADLYNIADSQFNTTGFPDPSGSEAVFYHPAAGRTLYLGVGVNR